jgi:hypothetical protein
MDDSRKNNSVLTNCVTSHPLFALAKRIHDRDKHKDNDEYLCCLGVGINTSNGDHSQS